ncbi:MAG: hypothetical protein KA508_00345 [Gammaproteobacteria bacterium]|nr:hypothetical protein [Gammaproteobacteria bacterium]
MFVKKLKKGTAQSSRKTSQRLKKALQIHSIISITIARQIQSEPKTTLFRKRLARQAFRLIDELDFLLEDPLGHLKQYTETYQALFLIINRLRLRRSIQHQIAEKFGDRFLMDP